MKRTLIAATVAAVAGLALASPAQADTYDDMFAAVDWLAHKYGVHVDVDAADLADGIFAQTRGDLIVFNTDYILDPARLQRDISADVKAGYHPGDLCTPAQVVAAHEFGHVLDYLTGNVTDREVVAAVNDGSLTGVVSGYSLTSPAEAVAEAVMAVECDVPTAAERQIYDMLMD